MKIRFYGSLVMWLGVTALLIALMPPRMQQVALGGGGVIIFAVVAACALWFVFGERQHGKAYK